MKKILIGIAVTIGILIFLYGSLAAMVEQGLSLFRAVAVFLVVILGGAWMVWALRGEATESSDEGDES
jgi:flagellar biosynthesis protein FliQ